MPLKGYLEKLIKIINEHIDKSIEFFIYKTILHNKIILG